MAERSPWLPFEDGLTHINMYSKSPVLLGRQLSHFAPIGFTHPEYGRFASMEGFWHWLKTGKIHEQFRTLEGHRAKNAGKDLPSVHHEGFALEIQKANQMRLEQNPELMSAFVQSTLPLTHYYVVGHGTNVTPIKTTTTDWLEYFFSRLRAQYQGTIPDKQLKVIVAGTRTIQSFDLVNRIINESPYVYRFSELVSGMARGPDLLAVKWAKERHIPIKEFPADWEKFDKRAGFIRNEEMANYADALIAIRVNDSPGTTHMLDTMRKLGKPTYLYDVKLEPA